MSPEQNLQSLQNFDVEAEVRTRSVALAGHLLALGYKPLGIVVRDDVKIIRFSPAARDAMQEYFAAKARIDEALDAAGTAR